MSKKNKSLKRKLVAHKDTINILDNALKSTRTQLQLTADDNHVKDRVVRIRDAKIRAMEEQGVINHKEFQRLMRDYERSLALVNSLTTNMKIKQE